MSGRQLSGLIVTPDKTIENNSWRDLLHCAVADGRHHFDCDPVALFPVGVTVVFVLVLLVESGVSDAHSGRSLTNGGK